MAAQYYRFGHFSVAVATRELREGNAPIELPARAFDCLVYLIEHRERAVGRDELIAAVWGRADVSEALLNPHDPEDPPRARRRWAVADSDRAAFRLSMGRCRREWRHSATRRRKRRRAGCRCNRSGKCRERYFARPAIVADCVERVVGNSHRCRDGDHLSAWAANARCRYEGRRTRAGRDRTAGHRAAGRRRSARRLGVAALRPHGSRREPPRAAARSGPRRAKASSRC